MDASTDLNGLKTALRDHLCVECPVRTPDDPPAPPAAAKCESDCSLFVNLPRLAKLVKEGEPPCGYAVFAKSLETCSGQVRGTDIVHALTILESATAEHSVEHQCEPASGCERLDRITTAVACLHQKDSY